MKIRHLTKIIFIKSADIDYQEINLDGNVHLIGDQGTGKSTALRALLYLYNPSNDKKRLGIGRDDKYFLDYYFEFDNSYIIYEIQTENSKFIIWLSKEGNRPAFRFIDTEYYTDDFIEKTLTGFRVLLADEIKHKFRERSIIIPRKIFLLNEYKNVLYGATKENRFKPYSLMQSNAYQNIPNTLTNIFLSTSLKSSNIKQTIIHSLIDEEQVENQNKYKIDLTNTREDIEEFEEDYNDIAAFDTIKIKAKELIALAKRYNKLEQEKIINAQNLGESQLFYKNELELVKSKFSNTETAYENIKTVLEQKKKNHREVEKEIEKNLTILKNDLKKAEKLNRKWKDIKVSENLIGIENILAKVSEKETLHNSQKAKDAELKTLKIQFDSIEQKYQVLFDRLNNEKNTTINTLNKKHSEKINNWNDKKSQTSDYYIKKTDELDEVFDKNIDNIRNQKDDIQNRLSILKENRAKINSTEFFKTEINDFIKKINELNDKEKTNSAEIKIQKTKIDGIRKQAETEEKLLRNEFQTSKNEISTEINNVKNQIKEIETDLQSFENSFYKFLNENYQGWEDKFAKICDKNILFNNTLKPKLHEISDLLYGLEIDLTEVDSKIKPIAEYETDKLELERALNQLQIKLQKLIDNNENNKTEFVRKRNKKINSIKRQIEIFEAEIYQYQVNCNKFTDKKNDLIKKADDEKIKQLSEISPKINDLGNQIVLIDNKIKKQVETKKEQKENIKEEKEQKINEIIKKQEIAQKEYENRINETENIFTEQRKFKNAEKLKELDGEGADIKIISELESKLQEIEIKLSDIEDLQEKYVNIYEVEKKEILKIPTYSDEIVETNNNLQNTIKENTTEFNDIDKQKTKLKEQFEELKSEKEIIETDISVFEDFEKEKIFNELAYYIEATTAQNKHDRLVQLITNIKDIIIDINSLFKELRKNTTDFVSPFRQNNIFNFPKEFSEDSDYLDFIQDNLREYIEEEKIEIVKQQTKKKHAGLINHIVGNIDLLVSKRKDIDKTITEINNDFKLDNFVNAIQEFEIRTQDTSNSIVQIFIEIKKHHDENTFNLEEPNLFTNKNMEESKQNSINLLTSLLKSLKEVTNSEINLEDIFELEFRAKQNNKNTGWKKELSDVGSHGTDILLKAMIYIMLLNVFKEKASKKSKFRDFRLHCIMDEIGRIHSKNIKSLIKFANSRDIWMIFGSPEENDALAYKYVYNFEKNDSITTATRLIYDRSK